MNLKRLMVFVVGIWSILTGLFFYMNLMGVMVPFFVALKKVAFSFLVYHVAISAVALLSSFLLIWGGVQFIRYMKAGLSTLLFMIPVCLLYVLFMTLVFGGLLYFQNMSIVKFFYLLWFIVLPCIFFIFLLLRKNTILNK